MVEKILEIEFIKLCKVILFGYGNIEKGVKGEELMVVLFLMRVIDNIS